MKIEKKIIDNAVRGYRGYYITKANIDTMALMHARENEIEENIKLLNGRIKYDRIIWIKEVIKSLAVYSKHSDYNYEWIYNVLKTIGIEIIESEKEND